jgi:VWFA-related protein
MRRALLAFLLAALLAAQQPPVSQFESSSNLVIVTAFVRDRDGRPLPNLKKEDFQVLENGKPQTIAVFEYQNLGAPDAATSGTASVVNEAPVTPGTPAPAASPQGRLRYRDRRLLVLFFDWSSMQPADQVRAKEAAQKFLSTQMTPADTVSILSFGSHLKVEQDFTSDRDLLIETVRKFQTGQMSELADMGNTDTDTSDDSAYTADDTEFNIFNTDRKLGALEDAARKLAALPEKKALIYFSSGVGKTGAENQSQLRATVNAAVRSNVSFYPIDVRGLVALPPGGDASTAGPRGTGLYTGATQTSRRQSFNDQQETLYTLAADTGGKALFDNNDLVVGVKQAQQDLQSYYILGYYSSDDRRDGRYRRVEVKFTSKIQARLDYRSGYFADKEFRNFSSFDKERQLEDALLLGDPATALPLAVEVDWFRLDGNRYFVPISVKLPGSVIPLAKKGGAETTQFDFIGQVRDGRGAMAASVRDNINIRLRDETAGKLAGASLLYDTGFTLVPGSYKIKMLVRENQSGKMGTFETAFKIPDLVTEKEGVRLSSVVWSSQRQPAKEAVGVADKKAALMRRHPLVRDGQKLIPSVTRVFRNGQTVYVYSEVYDPSVTEEQRRPAIAATVALYRDRQKVWESRPLLAATTLEGRVNTVPLMMELPLKDLPPGSYTAQLTVIDPRAKHFGVSRTPIFILAAPKS